MATNLWTVDQHRTTPQVKIITIEASRSAGWEQWVLLTSDRHIDSVHSDWEMEERHLREALERNAPIIDFGDFFDVMQGKKDRRKGDHRDLHPIIRESEESYFDAIQNEFFPRYDEYASQFAVISPGNHETAIHQHTEIDLTKTLTRNLRRCSGKPWPMLGTYEGFVVLRVKSSTVLRSKLIYYHHGHGGGGIISRGIHNAPRRAAVVPQAHVIASGHIHKMLITPIRRKMLDQQYQLFLDPQWHVQTGSYKDNGTRCGGWEVEKGMPSDQPGQIWLRLYWSGPDQLAIAPSFAL